MMDRIAGMFAALVLGLAAAPVLAQGVGAHDPQGIVTALSLEGHEASITTDAAGDPLVEVDLGGYQTGIYFYGCSDANHDGCSELQFQVALDADTPMDAGRVVEFVRQWRFAALTLDEEGDPVLTYDVITGKDGIPLPVFLETVDAFTGSIAELADFVWPEDAMVEAAAEVGADTDPAIGEEAVAQ